MDTVWMRERLENYLRLCSAYNAAYEDAGYEWNGQAEQVNNDVTLEIPTVKRIIELLDSSFDGELLPPSYASSDGARKVRLALGALRDRDEWQTRLAPEAPSLTADRLHPMIWQAAATVWDTGEFKMATQQAAVSLSAHIRAKAMSNLNERKLVQQVFAPESPKNGQPRLHFPGNPSDDNWQSRQQGLHLIAQGAFAGIRNIAVHDEAPLREHEALEHLAVLSVVARWTDQTVQVAP